MSSLRISELRRFKYNSSHAVADCRKKNCVRQRVTRKIKSFVYFVYFRVSLAKYTSNFYHNDGGVLGQISFFASECQKAQVSHKEYITSKTLLVTYCCEGNEGRGVDSSKEHLNVKCSFFSWKINSCKARSGENNANLLKHKIKCIKV